MSSKVRVLFLGTSPKDTKPLRLDEEIREIQQHIRAAEFRDNFEFVPRMAVRPRDLLQAFNEVKPDIVHFSGHGSCDAQLLLEDDAGNATPVSDAALEALFRSANENIRLVVLNTCDSEAQAEIVARHVECAIGMKVPIGDRAAITFAYSLYGALAFGIPVGRAFEQGRTALLLEGIPEEDTPTLKLRPGGDASGITFGSRQQPTPVLPPVAIEMLLSAVESNRPVQIAKSDGTMAVLAGAKQFDSKFNLEKAAEYEHAVSLLVQAGLLKPLERGLHYVSVAGFQFARQQPLQSLVPSVRDTLSDDAKNLLVSACQCEEGNKGIVIQSHTMRGVTIQAGSKEFANPDDGERAEARWESAVEELAKLKLIEDQGYKREVFKVTHRGYSVFDEIVEERGLYEMPESPKN